MHQRLLTLFAAALITSCVSVSSGKHLDPDLIATVKPGVTTESQLIQMFGEPTSRSLNAEGQKALGWIYTRSKEKNPFKVEIQQQILSATINDKGVVAKVQVSDTVPRN